MKKLALLATVLTIGAAAPAPVLAANATSPAGHQPVKAEVTNPDPSNFTINLKKAANLGVDQKAKTFAMYTTGRVPAQCGDFSTISLNYKKPDKYTRIFNLEKQPEVLAALDKYGCVIIPNKPTLAPAKS